MIRLAWQSGEWQEWGRPVTDHWARDDMIYGLFIVLSDGLYCVCLSGITQAEHETLDGAKVHYDLLAATRDWP